MNELKRKITEKTVMFWVRMALRALAWILLSYMAYYRIINPLKEGVDISFTVGDKQVFFWTVGFLLSIEAVKKVFDIVVKRRFSNNTNNNNNKDA